MFNNSEEVLKYISDEKVEYVDIRFCDLPGVMQHLTVPATRVRPGLHRRRHRVRRLVRPRLPGDQRVGHGAVPRRGHRAARPVPQAQDAQHELLRARPDHGRGLQPRPAQRGAQGRGVPGVDGRRRHLLLRCRGRVLHLRLRAVRHGGARELPPHRLRRGLVEHRPRGGRRQPRLQGQLQGRVLPGPAGRPLRRPARRHGHQPDQRRVQDRARPPRGGHRRPGRDQLPVQHPAALRRRPDAVQVHHQEHGLARGQDRHLHAEAALRRQRLGHARPPVAVEGRLAAVLRRGGLRRPVGHRRATTSAACCTTRRACWPSPTRR